MTEKADRSSDEAGPGTELVKAPRDGTAPDALRPARGSGLRCSGPRRAGANGHGRGLHLPACLPPPLAAGDHPGTGLRRGGGGRGLVRGDGAVYGDRALQVSANQTNIVFNHNGDSTSSFEVFKGTQQQMLTSDVVLVAALRKPEAASLAAVKKEDDPVRWLARNLRVEFPGNAEIMRVSLTGEKPDEAAVLVGAVVDAYMNEVVDVRAKAAEGPVG